jgi:hypothetical protein
MKQALAIAIIATGLNLPSTPMEVRVNWSDATPAKVHLLTSNDVQPGRRTISRAAVFTTAPHLPTDSQECWFDADLSGCE